MIACLLALLAGCGSAGDGREVVRFWAMGREGEVVAQLMPDFERLNPGIRVQVQQIPFISAHEKLLTAFAGDATPDVAQLGSSWVPEMVALGALEPLDARLRSSPAIDPRDYFHGPMRGNVVAGRTWGVPWYADTRLLFYRSDLLRAAGFSAPPPTGPTGCAAMRAIKARAAPGDYAILLPINEYEPLLALALQQPRAAAARRRPLRQFPFARLHPRARTSISACSARGWRRRSATPRFPTSMTSSRAAASPSTSAGRGKSASSSAGSRPSARATG